VQSRRKNQSNVVSAKPVKSLAAPVIDPGAMTPHTPIAPHTRTDDAKTQLICEKYFERIMVCLPHGCIKMPLREPGDGFPGGFAAV